LINQRQLDISKQQDDLLNKLRDRRNRRKKNPDDPEVNDEIEELVKAAQLLLNKQDDSN